MIFTEDEIIQILKVVEESKFDELHLESGDLKLIVRKGGAGPAPLAVEKVDSVRATAPKPDIAKAPPEPSAIEETCESKCIEDEAIEEGHLPIKAPLLGTFYRRAEPNAPPFVEVGTYVDEDTTVCIIEVMKVFSTIKAGIKGHISKICAQNANLVEYGQPLFYVNPQ